MTIKIPLHDSEWLKELESELNSEYYNQLLEFLAAEKKQYSVYPPDSLIYNALNRTPYNKVKVVIIGQDPYHGVGQAHGLSFSVPFGVKTPPSLKNMYKELYADLGIPIPAHGNLEKWADQGVLLLNATLTVRANQAGSHQGKGWGKLTNAIIKKLSEGREGIVFMLWGRFAHEKESLINKKTHHILKAAHPSPLSAYNGFFGCKHFSKTNEFLRQKGIKEINWNPGDGGLFG